MERNFERFVEILTVATCVILFSAFFGLVTQADQSIHDQIAAQQKKELLKSSTAKVSIALMGEAE